MADQLESKTVVFQGLFILDWYYKVEFILEMFSIATSQSAHCTFHSKEETFIECVLPAQEGFPQKL